MQPLTYGETLSGKTTVILHNKNVCDIRKNAERTDQTNTVGQ